MGPLIRILLVILASLALPAHAAERVLLTPAGTTERAKTATKGFATLMKTANEKGSVKVIVGLRVPFAAEGKLKAAEAEGQRADIARAANSFRSRMDVAIRRKPASFRAFTTVPFAALEVTAAELRKLAADPEVISISPSQTYKRHLAVSTPMIRANEAWSAGFSGAGQTIAIIDTGVDKTHPFLANKVVAEACFSEGGWCPGGATTSTAPGAGMPCPSDCSHGTHVAGIAAGRGVSFSGVARDANIIAIQAFSPNPGGPNIIYSGDMIAATEHVYSLRNRFSIASVNMSFGGYSPTPGNCDAGEPAMAAAIANLWSAGIATVASSGNDFSTEGMASPACMSKAVSVGAVATKDWGNCMGSHGPTARDKVACFSSSSPQLSLLAPGLTINSSIPGGGFDSYEGTSMAAPHVAGAWAVLKQRKPDATVAELLGMLQASGVPVTDYRNGRPHKRIDVKAALDVLTTGDFVLSYTKGGKGTGTVSIAASGSSKQCELGCAGIYAPGTVLTLTAAPTNGSSFIGWSGACSGTGSCTVTMSESRSVTANFKPAQMTLTYIKGGSGDGSVSFYPSGGEMEACSTSCDKTYDAGTVVTAIVKPAAGSLFDGYAGACNFGGDCRFTMSGPQTLRGSFSKADGSELPLTYEKMGRGAGTVVFYPAGSQFRCDDSCVNLFRPDTKVWLRPVADNGSFLAGMSIECTDGFCPVEMSEARKVTATFKLYPFQLSYNKSGTGVGKVVFSHAGGQYSCKTTCMTPLEPGTFVTLTASTHEGSAFTGWSGACSGKNTCTVTMDAAKLVTANFDTVKIVEVPLTLQRSGTGHGFVTFDAEAGKLGSCTSNCVIRFRAGNDVKLTPKPAAGSVFKGWSGACSGTEECNLSMENPVTVSAVFEATGSPRVPLFASWSGTGEGGLIVAPDGGTNYCQHGCVNAYPPRTRVEVMPAGLREDTVFAGWTGACRGKGRCIVTMRRAATVGAIFKKVPMFDLNYTEAGTGGGELYFMNSAAADCRNSCVKSFKTGERVTFEVEADEGSVFTGWSGACRGKKPKCTVTMKQARNVTATFMLRNSSTSAAADTKGSPQAD